MKCGTRQRVAELHGLALSVSEIAERAGVSSRHARRLLVELGMVNPGQKHPRIPETALDRMRAMIEDGCSFREIARTLGVRWETVERHFPGRQWTKAQAASHGQLLRPVRLP